MSAGSAAQRRLPTISSAPPPPKASPVSASDPGMPFAQDGTDPPAAGRAHPRSARRLEIAHEAAKVEALAHALRIARTRPRRDSEPVHPD